MEADVWTGRVSGASNAPRGRQSFMVALNLMSKRGQASSKQQKTKIGILSGLPALGLDSLSSAAYGPEAALTILLPLGVSGLVYIGPITCTIIALLVVFRGVTDRLIPLFAVGAFLAFTLSQSGMVLHWHKQARKGGHSGGSIAVRMAANFLGAAATACALLIILTAKFKEGTWSTVLAIPLMLAIFKLTRWRQGIAKKKSK